MTYKQGSLNFKDLIFSWKLITSVKDEHGEHEVFNIEIEKDGVKIRQEFNNSVMEFDISKKIEYCLKEKMIFPQARDIIRPKMWGGYDKDINEKGKIKSYVELDLKRVYNLLYSIINDFSRYIEFLDTNPTFKDFCSNFGYDEDSRKSEKIYNSCIDYYNKIKTLNLSSDQISYFIDEVDRETETFSSDLKEEVQK